MTLYFGQGALTLRGLPAVEHRLATWQRWNDAGDRSWYHWIYAVRNYPSERRLTIYYAPQANLLV